MHVTNLASRSIPKNSQTCPSFMEGHDNLLKIR